MKRNSIKYNAMMNTINTIMSVIFPLITFPYMCKVLGVVNLGRISFGESIIGYFLLIASLGINNYAIREGAAIRDDESKLTKFVSQMFSINICATGVAYLLLICTIFYSSKLQDNFLLIMIQSIMILSTTIGVGWFFSVKEEFCLVTIRSIFVSLLSLIGLFVFVRDSEDYYFYVIINVIVSFGGNLFSCFYIRKKCRFVFTLNMNIKKHIKPILFLFAYDVMMVLYVNSDITILGFLCGDYEVGLYSTSVKIYKMIKLIINAIIIVSLPRLSYYIENNMIMEYKALLKKELDMLVLLVFPAIIGLEILAEPIIIMVAGEEYLQAVPSLQVLGISILFALLSSFIINSILIPRKREKVCLLDAFVSAVANIGLNFLLIPWLMSVGAAITTMVAEVIVFVLSCCFTKNDLKDIKINKNFIQSASACVIMIIIISTMKKLFEDSVLLCITTSIFAGIFVYFLILFVEKNELVCDCIEDIKKKSQKDA